MTSGSGNGWPDVVKVPAQKVDHDPLCRQQHWEGGDCFDCRLIAKVRADERERTNTVGGHRQIRDEGRADMCADLRAQVEALQVFNVDSGVDPYRYVIEPLLRRSDVLAIIDGASNE